jgi:transposase
MSSEAGRQGGRKKVISQEAFVKIATMEEMGMYHKDIAKAVGVHPKTVKRALARGSAPKRERAKRGSKLEPYKAKVDELLAAGVWNGTVILREIEAMGYTGKRTVLRNYIKPKRALRSGKATVRFETEPGEQMQSDWGTAWVEIGGVKTEVKFCVNTLGYSRRFQFWCTDSEDAEHTFEGIQRGFEWFGGVTERVLIDNQKAAVFNHPQSGAVYQKRYLDFAAHLGFQPQACKPYRARTKGKDERMVGYIKQHFFVRYRAFESWAHLNQQAEHWLRAEADQRKHGTVHEIVAERFERERPQLKALPRVRYDSSYYDVRKVSWDGYIEVHGNRYSVPSEQAGHSVSVRIGLDGQVLVFAGDACIARHTLQDRSAGWVTVAAHHAELWRHTLNTVKVVSPQVEQRSLSAYQEAAQVTVPGEVSSWS